MSRKAAVPYGSWESPISSNLIVSDAVGLDQTRLDGQSVYWIETRPGEGGRNVVVRRDPDGRAQDLTPQPFNVRTRVHEYGGGDFAVADGTLYFVNFPDQRLYSLSPGGEPRPLAGGANRRYADMVVDERRRRIVAVREDHSEAGHEPTNALVAIDLEGGSETVLVSGADFYSSQRLSPDGGSLAWLSWRHPNMPWDGTELWVAEVGSDGRLGRAGRVAGGDDESIFQPEWSPESTLYFVSDRSGWWNLYRFHGGIVEPLCEKEAEFGLPQWVFGMSTYAFLSPEEIVCTYIENGSSRLAVLDTWGGRLEPIETPYTSIAQLRASRAMGRVIFIGGSPTKTACVVSLDPHTGEHEVLRRSREVEMDPAYLSIPEPVEFPTRDGRTAHAFFYPPNNRDHAGPEGEKPPLLVVSHGGPTSMTRATLNPQVQFWTSRGIAVLDVNYGGSTGYGREYRRRLYGQWGIVDVEDCENGAKYLAESGLADAERLMVRGGSAGGYTTLCALTFGEAFAAGASYYGVSDAEALARETHKFESRYLDQLIGPYPERADLYRERSPIHAAQSLSRPVIFFQGLEDEVVPPNQAETMVASLREKGIAVAYVPFEGEQHGFRRAENIKRALDAELYFYSRVLGFEISGAVDPVPIENL